MVHLLPPSSNCQLSPWIQSISEVARPAREPCARCGQCQYDGSGVCIAVATGLRLHRRGDVRPLCVAASCNEQLFLLVFLLVFSSRASSFRWSSMTKAIQSRGSGATNVSSHAGRHARFTSGLPKQSCGCAARLAARSMHPDGLCRLTRMMFAAA